MPPLFRTTCTAFLLMAMGADNVIDRSIYGAWPGKSGDKVTEALNIIRIILSAALFWWGINQPQIARINRVFPISFAIFLVISIFWSFSPALTATRGVAYLFMVVGAIGSVDLSENDELMDLIGWSIGFSAVASLLLLVVSPDSALTSVTWGSTELRGVFTHKNMLGQVMAAGVLSGLHGLRVRDRRRFRYISLIVLCTCVAIASKSSTAVLMICTLFGLSVLTTLYVANNQVLAIALALTSVPGVVFVISNQDILLTFLQKDASLTGRTELWPYVIDMIYQAPVLGWGFQAFWSPANPLALAISTAVGWDVPQAHNGVLEMLLQLGVVGTGFLLILVGRNFILAGKCINGASKQIGASSILFLGSIIILSISENVLLTPDQFSTTQFFIMGLMCEKALWLKRRQYQENYPNRRVMRSLDLASQVHDAGSGRVV
jgi:exopolysaccharide production protein ExoQ